MRSGGAFLPDNQITISLLLRREIRRRLDVRLRGHLPQCGLDELVSLAAAS
jgi:hypothetical protein